MSADLLFLHGPSGAGKTRLLQMIEESCTESSIMRVGCEQIIADIPRYFRDRDYDGFYDKYTSVKNLLLDNLWVLRRHRALAEETGKLLRARMARANLTIVASDLSYEEVIDALPAIGLCLQEPETVQLRIPARQSAIISPSLEELIRTSMEDSV
jgi:chromosomal replication initiation ATPase DnaA